MAIRLSQFPNHVFQGRKKRKRSLQGFWKDKEASIRGPERTFEGTRPYRGRDETRPPILPMQSPIDRTVHNRSNMDRNVNMLQLVDIDKEIKRVARYTRLGRDDEENIVGS